MRRALLALGALVLVGAALLLFAALRASRPLFDETLAADAPAALEIADPGRALTFARERGERGRTLLVTAHHGDRVEAVDANAYFGSRAHGPIELLRAQGYEALAAAALAPGERLQVPETQLGLPLAARGFESDHHLAAGANFAAHGAEAGVAEPFVFPKRVRPTPWNAPVPKCEARRLDYEVELCFVALREIAAPGELPPLGLVLCNDFTDRWSLVLGMAAGDGEMGTRGFADGKGAPGFLPVGPFLVIPRDLDAFYPEIELSLWVNGRLRQRARAGAMIWKPPEILEQAFARDEWDFDYAGAPTRLLPEGGLPAGALILSGTPEGVIFRLANLWWSVPYLDAGDEVIAAASYLGRLRNPVAEGCSGAPGASSR